jgi:hypothetical protein
MLIFPLSAVRAESTPPTGNIVPSKDVIVAYDAAVDLGWAKPGQQFYCIGQTRTGYSVLASLNGRPCIGFIPYTDEWGRPAAETWEFSNTLSNNIIGIRTPIKIEPGRVVLKQGRYYPATAAGKGIYTIRYNVPNFKTTITVSSNTDLTFIDASLSAPAPEIGDTKAAAVVPPAIQAELKEIASGSAEPAVTGAPAGELIIEPAPAAEQKPLMPEIPKIDHAARGAKITVSSTHKGENGEGAPENLVDGDLQSRWSSEYSEPQEVVVELPKEQKLAKVRLHWEVAAADTYNVLVSVDGKEWKTTQTMTDGKIGPRIDELDMKKTPVKFIKLELINRIHDTWGFSLYEIEAVAQE